MRRPYRGRPPQCLKCEPRVIQAGEVEVKLLHAGRTKVVYRSRKSSIKFAGKHYELGALQAKLGGTLLILVDYDSWALGRVKPRAIKGLPVSWPISLEFETTSFMNLLEEIVHYLKLGECIPVSIKWWVDKFRSGSKRDTGLRAWERFKKRLRDLGVPMSEETIWKSRHEPPEIAIRIEREKFIRVVEAETGRRREAKGIQ